MIKRIFNKENRALLSELVRTDFKLRYQGSVLGYVWSLLSPLLLFIVLYIVFVNFLKFGGSIPHYPVYLFLGIVTWTFFKELTTQGLQSIVMRGDLIRKIRIPRWIIVMSSSISALISLALNLVIVFFIMVLNKAPIHMSAAFLPLLLIEVYLSGLGLSLLLAALYVKYRDVSYIWEVFLQAGFYITPTLYPLYRIHSLTMKKIIVLNPIANALQDARYAVVTHQAETTHSVFKHGWYSYIPYVVVVLVLLLGISYFRSQSKGFAENI